MSDTESVPEGSTQANPSRFASGAIDRNEAASAEILPGDTVGRYQVRGLLGAGGMGQVFTAYDLELGRPVALKVVRPNGKVAPSLSRARLLREAQALARLQHPNVVAIYDVGVQGEDRVYIAMELIAGQTLTAWLGATARPWRAIRDVFVAAGRGLAAAHAAGLVHRDFKPSNVIVGADRVVVVDFGLARAGEDDAEGASGGDDSVLGVDLTLTGERMGTPRYMAPEQHAGGPVTPLADQFAFATSLWAALYDALPFTGETRAEVVEAMTRGPAPPPAERKVPERVRAALARALAVRPSDRWPTLADLLAELTRDPAAARRRILAILAVAIAAIAAPIAFVVGRHTPEPSCAAPATGIWDEATQAEVRSAFLATGAPHAADSFQRVDAALRARLGAWAAAHEEACAATEIRHEQSAALMDARMGCLARARDEIAAFIRVLRAADVHGVDRASVPASRVGDFETCADVSALTDMLPAPRDPQTAAKVDDLERELARVAALALVGHMKEAYAAGPDLVARARALGHPPLLARALYEVGTTACDVGDPRDATAMLFEAARTAGAAHDDVLAAKVYIELVYCVGARDVDFQAAAAFAEAAQAALARAGTPPDLRARLFRDEGRVRRHAGDPVIAFGFAELALMSYQRAYGEESPEVARSLGDLVGIMLALGAYRGALAVYARALPLLERTHGPNHPNVGAYLHNMAAAAFESGDLAGAADGFERAIAMAEQTYGAGQGGSRALLGLAQTREQQGRLEAARELALRALAVDEKLRRPDHPDLAWDHLTLCGLALDQGNLDEAQARCDKAVDIRVAAYGPDHPDVADVQVLRAQIARKRHDVEGARELIERALAVHRKALGARHPTVAADDSALAAVLLETGNARAALPLVEEALPVEENARYDDAAAVVTARTLLAEALLATGDPGRALAVAERAVAAATARRPRADIDGLARFAWAQALDATDRPRALRLAREARGLLVGSPAADQVARVDRWLGGR